MRSWIQRMVRKRGYEIRKAPRPGFECVRVFDLAMRYLLVTRGRELTFAEVGANDGKSTDPLREYIVNNPWRGLLIEPQPDVFDRLKENYQGFGDRLAFENVAISSDPQPIALYRAPQSAASVGAATVVSSNQEITAKQLGLKKHELEKIMVPTARLDDVLARHGLTALDVLQLDTEGFDWDVLQTLDLKKTRPLFLAFEHGHLPPDAIGKMTQHLNEHGYQVNYGGWESDSLALRNDFLV